MRLSWFIAHLVVGGTVASYDHSLEARGAAVAEHEAVQRSVHDRTWVAETRGLLDDFGTCTGCQNILSLLSGLVEDSDDELISLGKTLCVSSTSYDEEFCDGILAREGPVIADMIRNIEIPSKTMTQFCITFLGVCKYPAINSWKVPFPSNPPCDRRRPSPSKKKPIQVVHYSDIHVDPLYLEGSSTECDKPTCCRPFTKDDQPGHSKSPAGPNGDHNCDTPVSLEESMYKAINKLVPDHAFTIFTGDIVDHNLANTSKNYVLGEINDAYDRMNDRFELVYGTIGNHESHPANIFEPNSLGNSSQWIYDTVSDDWSQWVHGKDGEDIKSIGAYSTKYPKGNLRVISLNTNMYYRFNFALYRENSAKDPNKQIAWLVKELDAAEKAGEAAYIIGHMPFGEFDALPDQSNYLDQVVNRYSSTIRAMFFGHTHVDHFEVTYSDYDRRSESNAAAVSYICPSLTPTSGMPSFRVYDVDPETFAVLDATTYVADMDDGAFQKSGPVWKKYYSAKEAYGSVLSPAVSDSAVELSPAFWHNVTVLFGGNQTVFDEYMSRKSRGWKDGNKCTGKCREEEICQLQAGRSQDNCFTPTAGVHFAKRSGGHDHAEFDDCGKSLAAEILQSLATRDDLLELLQERFIAVGAKVRPFKRADQQTSAEDETATTDPSITTSAECVQLTTIPTNAGEDSAPAASSTSTDAAVAAEPVGAWPLVVLGLMAL